MGKDGLDENADQIKFSARLLDSVGRFMRMRACIFLGCLTDKAAEYSWRNSTISIRLRQFMSPSHPSQSYEQ